MKIASLNVILRLEDARGGRDRRRQVRAIVDRLRRHFNVSVAEADRPDHPHESVIGVVAIAPSKREVRETLARVADALAAHPRAELLAQDIFEV